MMSEVLVTSIDQQAYTVIIHDAATVSELLEASLLASGHQPFTDNVELRDFTGRLYEESLPVQQVVRALNGYPNEVRARYAYHGFHVNLKPGVHG